MSMEEVIKHGKGIGLQWEEYITVLSVIGLVLFLFFLVKSIKAIVKGRKAEKYKKSDCWFDAGMYVVFALFSIFFAVIMGYMNSDNNRGERVEEWKKEYVAPYLSSIDSKKLRVTDVRLTRGSGPKRYAPSVKETGLKRLVLEIEKDYVYTEEGYFVIKRDVPSKKDMYLEYKPVSKDLGNGLNKGKYNAVVHVTMDKDI